MFFEKIKSKLLQHYDKYTENQKYLINVSVRLVIIAFILIVLLQILFNGNKDIDTDNQNTEIAISATEANSEEDKETIDENDIIAEIRNKISASEYSEALSVLDELKTVNENNENIYLYEADIYLKQGDYLSAVNVLEKGIDITSSELLINRKKYICNNVVLVNITSEYGNDQIRYQYDSNGNLIHDDIYNTEYEITGWYEYSYDEFGLLSSCSTFNAKGNLEKRSNYTYDAANKLILVEDFDSKNVKQGWHEYSYDNIGRETTVLDYGKNKKLGWKTTTEYDSEGRLFRNTGYDGRNRATGWVDTSYDNDGRVIEMVRFDNKGKKVEWNETSYNGIGNPVQFISYTKNNKITNRTEFSYDSNNKKTKEIYFNGKGIETGFAIFNTADKKTEVNDIETGEKRYFEYRYIGDVLSDIDITPASGTLTFNGSAKYKRVPSRRSAYIGNVNKNTTYKVIGETADFYQVDKGWYFYKNDISVVYNK